MVELIVGKKGKGKTKVLLDRVNGAVKEANGSIVYLDKSTKHMYELNNKVRLIDVSSYPLKNADEFVGFICGIISQDHDLEQIYLDSFLKVSKLEDADVTDTLDQLDKIGEKYGISIVVSISLDQEEIPEALQDKIASLTAEKATLTAEISQRNQNATILNAVGQQIAPLAAGLQALQSDVDGIKCKLPNTVPVQYPNIVGVNMDTYRAAAFGAYVGDSAYGRSGCGCNNYWG